MTNRRRKKATQIIKGGTKASEKTPQMPLGAASGGVLVYIENEKSCVEWRGVRRTLLHTPSAWGAQGLYRREKKRK
jgi:hypothetical protein